MKIINEFYSGYYTESEFSLGTFIQYEDGKVFFKKDGKEKEVEWYKNANGTNWKCSPKSFKSLLKQALKEDELIFIEDEVCEYCDGTGEVSEDEIDESGNVARGTLTKKCICRIPEEDGDTWRDNNEDR